MGFGIFKRSFVVRRFGEERLIDGYGVADYAIERKPSPKVSSGSSA